MGFGISLPSLSDIGHAVTGTVAKVGGEVRDLGSAAVGHAADLARDGADLGRQAVDAVSHLDVRAAADTVRGAIGTGIDAAKGGITTAVTWSGRQVGAAADYAREHVPGDNIVSDTLRSAITVGEDVTRFQIGVVGGVTREAVGLVGDAGQLAVTAAEIQASPQAAQDYGRALLGAAGDAAEGVGHYAASVATDPSRVVGDVKGAAGAVGDAVGGQLDRYGQAIAAGRGPETIGMDVGAVATYVIPVGGIAKGAVEVGAKATAEIGARTLVESGGRALAGAGARETGELALRSGTGEVIGTVARTPEALGTMLRETTGGELAAMREAGTSARAIGPAASRAVDSRTGEVSRVFVNDRAGQVPADLHPTLASRLDAARKVPYEKTHGAGSHAEIYAVNELLTRGSRLEDLMVYTEGTRGSLAGTVKPPCPQCSLLLDGVTYVR